jgi:hypothetical protein
MAAHRLPLLARCGATSALSRPVCGRPGSSPAGAKRWSKEQIIEAMREFERETDFWPRSTDWTVACEDWPAAGTVYNRFGSWQAALKAAKEGAGLVA